MSVRRFKAQAEKLADQARQDLGLPLDDRRRARAVGLASLHSAVAIPRDLRMIADQATMSPSAETGSSRESSRAAVRCPMPAR
jgi:hypothetical protein